MKKSKILLPLTLAFVATASGAIAASNVKAAAEDTFKMVEGSSIQIRVNQDTNKYGIKFAANVGTKVEGATYNLMIVPVDYVNAYNAIEGTKKDLAAFMLDAKAANADMPLAIASDLEVDENGRIEGSIVDIRWENLSEQFVGAAYYTLADGTVKCAALATDGTRSIVDVATKALQSGDYAANETVTGVLKGFVYNAIQEQLGTSFENKDEAGNEAKISFAEATKSVYVGDEITVNYTPYVAADMAKWSSTVESVATVENGKITAKAAGTTTINVSLLDLTASYTLEVKTPTITGAKVEGATVTWDAIDGATYVVSLNGVAQEAQTETSYTLTADGVYDISVAATKNDVTGEATVVAEDYIYTEDDIVLGTTYMSDISFTELTHEKGSITYTGTATQKRYASGIVLKGGYTEQFLKVNFTAISNSMEGNAIALGFRGTGKSDTYTDALVTGQFSIAPESTNGGYLSIPYTDPAFVAENNKSGYHDFADWMSGAQSATGENLINGFSLTSGFTTGSEYSYLLGVYGKNGNESIYFGIYEGDTLKYLRKWTWAGLQSRALNYLHGSTFPSLAESGAFNIWEYSSTTRTISYEVLENVSATLASYDKPTITTDGNTVEWNTVGWAEGYKVSVNGGEYVTQTATTYTLPSYGVYTVSVKAYKGTTESAVSTVKDYYYVEEDIGFSGVSGVSFTTLNHSKGEITYTGSNPASWTASAIMLKKAYSTEFIKLGFKAVGTTLGAQGLHIGFRQTSLATWYLTGYTMYTSANGGQMTLNYQSHTLNDYTSKYSGTSYGEAVIENGSTLTEGAQYYILAGIVSTGENAQFYFYLLDSNDTVIKFYKWTYSVLVQNKTSLPKPTDSGYVTIWNGSTTSRTLTYEFIDPTNFLMENDIPVLKAVTNTVSWSPTNWADGYKVSLNGGGWTTQTEASYQVSSYGVYNLQVKAYKGELETAVASVEFAYLKDDISFANMSNITSSSMSHSSGSVNYTVDSAVTSRKAAAITLKKAYGNQFIKVGFKAIGNSIYSNKLTIGFRGTAIQVDPLVAWTTGHGQYGSGINVQFNGNSPLCYVPLYASGNANAVGTTLTYDSSFNPGTSFKEGEQYYYVVGVVGKGTNAAIYFGVYDKNDTVLHLAKWLWSDINNVKTVSQIADTGYFTIMDWNAGATRSLTYEIIEDSSTIYSQYETVA